MLHFADIEARLSANDGSWVVGVATAMTALLPMMMAMMTIGGRSSWVRGTANCHRFRRGLWWWWPRSAAGSRCCVVVWWWISAMTMMMMVGLVRQQVVQFISLARVLSLNIFGEPRDLWSASRTYFVLFVVIFACMRFGSHARSRTGWLPAHTTNWLSSTSSPKPLGAELARDTRSSGGSC